MQARAARVTPMAVVIKGMHWIDKPGSDAEAHGVPRDFSCDHRWVVRWVSVVERRCREKPDGWSRVRRVNIW